METFYLPSPLALYGEIHSCSNPRGLIVFCHGLGEHFGRYTRLIEFFNNQGLICVGTDHFGHGKSQGKRGDAPNYDIFLNEIDQIFSLASKKYPDLPLFLYGHSMGGNIVLNYLKHRNTSHITAAIASSPWITLPSEVPFLKQLLANIMNLVYPAFTAPNELDPNGISHDQDMVRQYVEDPLVHDRISVRLFKMMSEYGLALLEAPEVIDLPVLLIHGTADPMTSVHGSENFANQNQQVELITFTDMYHELHHEIIHNEVLELAGNFLNSHLH